MKRDAELVVIGSGPIIDAKHASQQKNQRVHLEVRRNPRMFRRERVQLLQQPRLQALPVILARRAHPESLGGRPDGASILPVGLDSPRGLGDSAERREFLGGLPERAEHDEGARLAVLLLFEPVEPETGGVFERHVHAHHAMKRRGGLRGGGEEREGGSVEFRGGAAEGVAEVDGVEPVELAQPVEEAAARAARRDRVDVDAALCEAVRKRRREGGRVEVAGLRGGEEEGVGAERGAPAEGFGLVLGAALLEPLLVEGGDFLLHEPLLVRHRVEEADRVLVLLVAKVAAGEGVGALRTSRSLPLPPPS